MRSKPSWLDYLGKLCSSELRFLGEMKVKLVARLRVGSKEHKCVRPRKTQRKSMAVRFIARWTSWINVIVNTWCASFPPRTIRYGLYRLNPTILSSSRVKCCPRTSDESINATRRGVIQHGDGHLVLTSPRKIKDAWRIWELWLLVETKRPRSH